MRRRRPPHWPTRVRAWFSRILHPLKPLSAFPITHYSHVATRAAHALAGHGSRAKIATILASEYAGSAQSCRATPHTPLRVRSFQCRPSCGRHWSDFLRSRSGTRCFSASILTTLGPLRRLGRLPVGRRAQSMVCGSHVQRAVPRGSSVVAIVTYNIRKR